MSDHCRMLLSNALRGASTTDEAAHRLSARWLFSSAERTDHRWATLHTIPTLERFVPAVTSVPKPAGNAAGKSFDSAVASFV